MTHKKEFKDKFVLERTGGADVLVRNVLQLSRYIAFYLDEQRFGQKVYTDFIATKIVI